MRCSHLSSNAAVLSLGVHLGPLCPSQSTVLPNLDMRYKCTHVFLIPVTVLTGSRLNASATLGGVVLMAATATIGNTDRRHLVSHLQPTRLRQEHQAVVYHLRLWGVLDRHLRVPQVASAITNRVSMGCCS